MFTANQLATLLCAMPALFLGFAWLLAIGFGLHRDLDGGDHAP